MPKNNLLLVDGDTQHLRVIEVSLRKSGFVVTTARNGAEALAKMSASMPDLVISETAMPVVDGFELCKRMSQDAQLRRIPLVFLTRDVSVESKVRGLELGAEDYLIRPIYTKELITRVQMMLRKHEQDVVKRGESRQRFFGDLENMGVVDLLQAMEMGRKNGTIRIETAEGHRGSMWFDDGQLIDGTTGGLNGEDAVYRMLTWDQGAFEIDFKPTQRPAAVNTPTQGVIMEGMRRMDEWARIAEQLPPLTTVLRVDYDELTERLSELPDESNALLRVFDGRRSILEAIDAFGQGDLEALTIISRLYFEGVLTRGTTELQDGDSTTLATVRGMRAPQVSSPPPSVAEELIRTVTGAPGQAEHIRETASFHSIEADGPTAPQTPPPSEIRKTKTSHSFDPIEPPPRAPSEPPPDLGEDLNETVVAQAAAPPPAPEADAEPLDELVQTVASTTVSRDPLASTAQEDAYWEMPGDRKKRKKAKPAVAVEEVLDQFLEGEEEIFPSFGTEDRLTDESEEESFFDSPHDAAYDDDDDFNFDDEPQPKKGPNKVLVVFGLVIAVGAGVFVFRDQVEPFKPADGALHSRWHEDLIKGQQPVGAVAPLEEDWHAPVDLEDGMAEAALAPVEDAEAEQAAAEALAPEPSESPLEAPEVSEAANRDARSLTNEGIKLYDGGKYKGAIGKFEQALALSPGTKSTLMAYVKALLEVGRARDSLEAAEKAARIDPKDAEIFLLLGNARQELGFDKESIMAYQKYLALAPSGSFAIEVKQVIKGLRANLGQ